MPFLGACVREGLRITCPSRVRMPRTVPEAGWAFRGHHYPPKVRRCAFSTTISTPAPIMHDRLADTNPQTIVSMSPLYLLHDEAVFPSPGSYDPSRWLVDGDQKRRLMSHFYPFSSGTRQCIGQSLSLVEQKIVLSLLVRRFSCGEVLKKKIGVQEAITVVIDDPVDVRLDLVTD